MPKTLNDIIPPSKRRSMGDMSAHESSYAPPPSYEAPPRERARRPRQNRKFPFGTALVALLVVAGSVGVLHFFSGATVQVTPQRNTAYVSAEFTASKGQGDLPYEVVVVEKIATSAVEAESTVEANDPATGTITIYNAQAKSQQLIKNTRFETPSGLIFRIKDSVVIPAGSSNAPGSITASVYSDEGGEKYNIPPSDFTVPGLKGGASFDLVYAKSTEPMTGGFAGTRPSVSEATREAEIAKIEASLRTDIQGELESKLPEGYMTMPGAYTITLETLPDAPGQGGKVEVRLRAVMKAFAVPNNALAKALAYQIAGGFSGQPITIEDTSGLTFSAITPESPDAVETYSFKIEGNTTLVWGIDETEVAGAVAGKSRESAQVIVSGLPSVDKAYMILRPFWAGSFPDDPEKIKVEVVEAKK